MVTEINQLDIKWNVDSKSIKKLDEASQEHIQRMIEDGYSSGELHVAYGRHRHLETSGWWEIIDWKNIALKFYNADSPDKLKEAKKEFEENWD